MGFCLANYTLKINASNVVVRFLRVRVGDQGSPEGADGRDAMFCRYTDRVIIDHCTFSWSIDETASAYFNTRFTMQWCLIAESLRLSLHAKDAHGYGGIWGGQGATFHHNLLAHHTSRNPRWNGSRNMPATHDGIAFTLEQAEMRNNVIYNWGFNSCYAAEPRDDGVPSRYNMVGNYFKSGPATSGSVSDRIVQPTAVGGIYSEFFLEGNVTTASSATTADNWLGVDGPSSSAKTVMRLNTAMPAAPLTEQTAEDAYLEVLARAGACYPVRDAVDARIVQEVETGTATYGANGIIDSQEQVGGWPVLQSTPAPADTDKDGMPDAWEIARNLNPNNANDRNVDPDGDGYTALEDYLNGLVNHLYPQPAVTIVATASGGALFSWDNQLNDRVAEVASDLSSWSELPGAPSGSHGSHELEAPADGPQFLRLSQANQAPFAQLSAPAIHTVYAAGALVNIVGEASDLDGTVASVEFFVDDASIGAVTAAPFAIDWLSTGDGLHTLHLVATDDRGAETASAHRPIWVLGGWDGSGQRYHAELGTVTDNLDLFERSNEGFHGSGYINFPSVAGLTFENVDGGSGGSAELTIRFALGVASPRSGVIVINGGTPQSVTFPATGAWTIWQTLVLNINLAPGATNTIQLIAIGSDLANLDEIIVVPTP